MSDYRHQSWDQDPVELDDSRYLDAVFHPDDAAEIRRRQDIGEYYTPESAPARIDPACGSGGFLVGPHDRVYDKYPPDGWEPMPTSYRVAGGALIAFIAGAALIQVLLRLGVI